MPKPQTEFLEGTTSIFKSIQALYINVNKSVLIFYVSLFLFCIVWVVSEVGTAAAWPYIAAFTPVTRTIVPRFGDREEHTPSKMNYEQAVEIQKTVI